jgi:O-antigen biosynthesis protein
MRMLVVDPYMPLFDCSSGHRRLMEILRMLVARGDVVSYVACEGRNQERYAAALRALGIEVYAGNPDVATEAGNLVVAAASGKSTDLASLLRDGRYDLVLCSYYQTAEAYLATVRRLCPRTRIIVDTVDVHFVREQREAQLCYDLELFRQATDTRRRELAVYSQADVVIAVTPVDRGHLLDNLPEANIQVIPNIHEVAADVPGWSERAGLLFVGNFHHRPNRDAVRFLGEEIMPRVWSKLPDLPLTVAGFAVPAEVQAFAGERVTIAGHVPDVTPYLRRHRISVVPLRFGAGLKGKIGESMAAGTPVVTTPIGAEGMPLANGPEALLIAEDGEGFADAVVRLHQDETLWGLLSTGGRELVLRNYCPQVVAKLVEAVFCGHA